MCPTVRHNKPHPMGNETRLELTHHGGAGGPGAKKLQTEAGEPNHPQEEEGGRALSFSLIKTQSSLHVAGIVGNNTGHMCTHVMQLLYHFANLGIKQIAYEGMVMDSTFF